MDSPTYRHVLYGCTTHSGSNGIGTRDSDSPDSLVAENESQAVESHTLQDCKHIYIQYLKLSMYLGMKATGVSSLRTQEFLVIYWHDSAHQAQLKQW
jgi:hypothetical protein